MHACMHDQLAACMHNNMQRTRVGCTTHEHLRAFAIGLWSEICLFKDKTRTEGWTNKDHSYIIVKLRKK